MACIVLMSTIWVSATGLGPDHGLLTELADLIADLNDYNDHAYNRFVEKIKVWLTMGCSHTCRFRGRYC